MILHTLNRAPSHHELYQTCLNALGLEDSLLLIENAVYAATQSDQIKNSLTKLALRGKLFVLANDFIARGLTADKVLPGAQLIGYQEFVALTVAHEKCVAWF